MSSTKQNLKMVDFASRDPRSCSSMLRGRGDGRERLWQQFQEENRQFFNEEELQIAFRHACRTQQNPSESRSLLGKVFLAALLMFAVIL